MINRIVSKVGESHAICLVPNGTNQNQWLNQATNLPELETRNSNGNRYGSYQQFGRNKSNDIRSYDQDNHSGASINPQLEVIAPLIEKMNANTREIVDSLRQDNRDGRRGDRSVPLRPEARWYEQFKEPWNQVPEPERINLDNRRKQISLLPKFNGEVETYFAFQRTVINRIHSVNITVEDKADLLQMMFDPKVKALSQLIRIFSLKGPQSYPEVIRIMESTFGGPMRKKVFVQSILQNLPKVRDHDVLCH